MDDAFKYRQNKLKRKNVGPTEIFNEFPRFIDFKCGSLVSN